jgi:tetratricopeptide (TPR) repeat protein
MGKSALALELARRLADRYEDGVCAVSFGAGAAARAPADVARELLLQLGWPGTAAEMPETVADRAGTLRSLTRGQSILFVFDAVRDHDQVRRILPAESRCAVIVTSRREIGSALGFARQTPLRRPSLYDCLELLSAVHGTPWTRQSEVAVEVVELCDRLPLAILAAAEQARDSGDLRYVAERLRSPQTRLATLDYGGRQVADKIESELFRLAEPVRRAIIHLSHLESESFVPWMLRPLMELNGDEPSAFAAALEAMQLIEYVGSDPSGLRRYRVNALASLYVRTQLARVVGDKALSEASRRLNDAYLDVMDDVHAVRDASYTRVRPVAVPPRFRTPAGTTVRSIAEDFDQVVRGEYLNLVRCILAADIRDYAKLIWRTAALLDGRVPSLLRRGQIDDIVKAFTKAINAAQTSEERFAEVEVLFAYAQFLIAIERYGAALEQLRNAETLLSDTQPGAEVRRLRLKRIESWAYVQAAAYGQARAALEEAEAIDATVPESERAGQRFRYDWELIQVFSQEARRTPDSRWGTQTHRQYDVGRFRAALQQSEVSRRHGFLLGAEVPLLDLLKRDGDARGRAAVKYRLARLKLEQAMDHARRKATDHERISAALSTEAAAHAAACVYVFSTIGDTAGQLRARILLLRALVFSGNIVAARQLSEEISAGLVEYGAVTEASGSGGRDVALRPLQARYQRALAELEAHRGRADLASEHLAEAARAFGEMKDWSNHALVWRVLDAEGAAR